MKYVLYVWFFDCLKVNDYEEEVLDFLEMCEVVVVME